MKGPRPLPTVLKILRGNPGGRPLNTREPHPGALAIYTPPELFRDRAACLEWKRTIIPAIQTGQITAADRAMAVGYCLLWSTWRSQLETASLHPHVVAVGKAHHPIPNPARVMANKTYLLLVKTAAELGLTPSSRSRVTVSGASGQEANPLAKYLKKAEGTGGL